MLNKEHDLKNIFRLLGAWITEIRLNNAVDYLDINKVSEGFAAKLLNLLFEYELEDLNKIQARFPGLDIGDLHKAKVAFQVTSRVDTAKVISSLRTSVNKQHHLKFTGGLKFLILREGEKVKFPKTSDPKKALLTFNEDRDILYPENLSKAIEHLYDADFAVFLQVKTLVERELQLILAERPDDIQRSLTQLTASFESRFNELSQHIQKPVQELTYMLLESADMPVINVRGKREKLVNDYITQLESTTVLWITGVSGTGKSSLAFLIAERINAIKCWVDFREISTANFITHLLSALSNTLKVGWASLSVMIPAIIKTLGQGGILVFNDLPDLSARLTNSNVFSNLVSEALNNGVHVVITSNYQPTTSFVGMFQESLNISPIPLFSQDETSEILSAYGAPDEVAAEHGKTVHILSEGYPIIINSIAAYLKDKQWEVNTDIINSIYKNNYADQLNHEIYEKVIASTEDADTLELLYRCRLILGTFTKNEVETVASVKPTVNQAAQKFERLKGIWIQSTQPYQFQLSPLVKRLDANLSQPRQAAIYAALAKSTLKNKTLNQLKAARALHYLTSAEAYMDAAMILTIVLRESLYKPSLFFDWGFSLYWFYSPLPHEINVLTRIYIRVLHVHICIAAKEEYGFLLDDINHILQTEKVDKAAVGLAHMLFYKVYSDSDPAKAMDYLVQAHQNESLKEVYNYHGDDFEDEHFVKSVWMSFVNCKKADDYAGWFDNYNKLSFPKSSFNPESDMAYVAAGLSIYINLVEHKPVGEAPEIIALLGKIAKLSIDSGLDLLAAYAIRNQILICCADLHSYDAAQSALVTHQTLIQRHPLYKFLIYDELGRQLMAAGQMDQAMTFLAEAVTFAPTEWSTEIVTTYRVFGQLVGATDVNEANQYTRKALEYVLNSPHFPVIEKIKLYGEAGISAWLAGDQAGAMETFEAGYRLLHQTFDNSNENRAMVLRYGSVANYVATLTLTGNPPTEAEDGPYSVPQRGSFFFTNDKLIESGMYTSERRFMTAYIFQNYHEQRGNYQQAREWAMACIQTMLDVEDPRFASMLHSSLLYLIKDDEYKKAVNVYNYIKTHYKPPKFKRNIVGDLEQQANAASVEVNETDHIFYNYFFIPVLFADIPAIIEHTGSYDSGAYIKRLFDDNALLVNDTSTLEFVKRMITASLRPNSSMTELSQLLSDYQGEYSLEMRVIGYLMFSIHASPKEAARLHLSMVSRLDGLYKHPFDQVFELLIIPFFERFWLVKAERCQQEFYDFHIWPIQSIPHFQKDKGKKKIKKLFQTLAYHLDLELPIEISEWMKSKS